MENVQLLFLFLHKKRAVKKKESQFPLMSKKKKNEKKELVPNIVFH